VAGASADGAPYLVPLSFDWEDEALPVATPTGSPDRKEAGRHPDRWLGPGHTRAMSSWTGGCRFSACPFV
jgi:hypothetical protein